MHVLAIGSCMPLKVALYNIIPNQERIPYSRKYWRALNLAVEPQIAVRRILNLAVQYGIAILIYASRKFWRILI